MIGNEFQTTTEIDAALNALRRRVYGFALGLGVIASLINLAFNVFFGTPDPYQQLFLPLLAISCGMLAVVLMRVPRAQKWVEAGMCAIAASSLLGRLYYGLYIGNPRIDIGAELSVLAAWFPIIYVLFFLILDGRRATIASFISYAAIGVVGVPYLVARQSQAALLNETFVLTQMVTSNLAYILLLSVLSSLKEKYADAHALAKAMHALAMTDALTGLPNRRRFTAALEHEIEHARRYARPLALIMFDLDHFKRVNDTLGHDAGDAMLCQAARRVREHLRGADQLSRWGGEEFFVLAPETDLERAKTLAEKLREMIEVEPFGRVGPVMASFGIAIYAEGDAPATLFKRADDALYRAKAGGRNRVEWG